MEDIKQDTIEYNKELANKNTEENDFSHWDNEDGKDVIINANTNDNINVSI